MADWERKSGDEKVIDTLRIENRLLREQIDSLRASSLDATASLAEARSAARTLRVERDNLRAENERLRTRLHEQTMQTQETATQVRQAVLDSIEAHGGLRGVGLGHPIEQIVGTLLEIYRCDAEELREKLDGALKRGDDWTEIAADLAAESTEATELAVAEWQRWSITGRHRSCSCPGCVAMTSLAMESTSTKPDPFGDIRESVECGTPEENAQALRDKFSQNQAEKNQ